MRVGLAGERLPPGQRGGAALLVSLPVNERAFAIEEIVDVSLCYVRPPSSA
jgi:hypothetical protein